MSPHVTRDRRVKSAWKTDTGLEIELDGGSRFGVVASGWQLQKIFGTITDCALDAVPILYMPNGMTPELWDEVGRVLRSSKVFAEATSAHPNIRHQIGLDFGSLYELPLRAYARGRRVVYVGHSVDFHSDATRGSAGPERLPYNLFSDGDFLLKTWVDTQLRCVHCEAGRVTGHFL